uniref:Uncharacterized protein n=1 Tax=Candidatus Kentrum eta TaxID=2126337 RepID=A0A450UZD8_9GAMM|nr:MAG: hypothetical protein BECKH772A_GA0070896_1001815 [Candidatus Kentron sp. H]VFJ90917.1 MAG: hypothetical protein BECKH772B_GA0070898_1001219 [Candidatus Kentron sp. H]VFJ97927.1 MAG: hypothetical protein BECKH772C_GA0070978_1001715 [Candidatus Kentron sp. H]
MARAKYIWAIIEVNRRAYSKDYQIGRTVMDELQIGELIVLFMVLVSIIGFGVVIKEIFGHK